MTQALCLNCRHFEGRAEVLERSIPALATLGSAMGAPRADDGLCARHGRHVRARAHCADFWAAA